MSMQVLYVKLAWARPVSLLSLTKKERRALKKGEEGLNTLTIFP